MFASAALLSLLVSFAPGGLGVTEALVVAIASTLGFDIGVSVVALGLVRLVLDLRHCANRGDQYGYYCKANP